jgi:hydrogenase nickel incorporation protein HypA/HybF
VKLGALSHFSPDHFREHFEQASRGTVAEGASLEIELLTDISDPRAQDVIVESVDIEEL